MRLARWILPLASALAAGLASAEPSAAPSASAADLSLRPGAPHPTGDTNCGACHTPEGWRPVSFAHDRTGFPLEGRHRDVSCKACHRTSSFADPLPRACSACHRDVAPGAAGAALPGLPRPDLLRQPGLRARGPPADRLPAHRAPRHGRLRGVPRRPPGPRLLAPQRPLPGLPRGRPGPRHRRRCGGGPRRASRPTAGAATRPGASPRPRSRPTRPASTSGAARTPPSAASTATPPCRPSTSGQPLTCTTDTAACLRCHGGVAPAARRRARLRHGEPQVLRVPPLRGGAVTSDREEGRR